MSHGPSLVHDAQTNEVARRIAAAFVSVQAGYAGVDLLLKRTPETASDFWYSIAEAVEKAFRESRRMRPSIHETGKI